MNIDLMLCVNDRNGQHTGSVDFVSIENHDIVLEAEGDRVPCGYAIFNKQGGFVTIGNVRIECSAYKHYVGNIHWNCAIVSVADVARVLNYLASQHWMLLEADIRLWDKWGALTEQDLREVMT